MTWSDTELAYTAGIIDGEGTITLHRERRKHRRYVILVVQVSNTDPNMIRWLLDRFGRQFNCHRRQRERVRALYRWTVSACTAEAVIRAVYPYLVTKKAQADLALMFRETYQGATRLDDGVKQARLEMQEQMAKLNRRGAEVN